MMDYLKDRAKEGNTWRGVVWFVAGLLGIQISNDQVTTILDVAAVVVGTMGMLTPEGKK